MERNSIIKELKMKLSSLLKYDTIKSAQERGLRAVLILGVIGMFSSLTIAQTLQTYQEEAAINSPELRASYLNYRAALEKGPQVSALPDPELGFMYFIRPIETRLGPQNARFSVTQMFPWFGTLSAKNNTAMAQAQAEFESFRERRNRLFFQMEQLWGELYEIEKAIEVANENLAIVQTLVEVSLRRYENGLVSQVDVLRAQIELEDIRTQVALLEDNRLVLISSFNELRDTDLQASVVLPDTLHLNPIRLSDEELGHRISQQNPALERLRYTQQAQKSSVDIAKKDGAPSFGLGLDYIATGERDDVSALPDNGKDAIIARASVKIPLFRKKYNAQVREAQLRLESTNETIQSRQNELTTQLEAALRDRNDAQRRFELYDLTQIQRVQQAINILMQSYSADNADFEEILRLQRKLYDYQLKRIQAKADQFKAQQYIEYLTGANNISLEEL
jgi:outer membrane protein TolC